MFGLPLELVLEMIQKSIVEVLAAQMSVSSCGLDGENTTSDVEERNIKSSSTQIENEDVLLGLGLLVEAVGNGRGCGLVDDTEDIKTGNGSGVFCSQSLRVIKVCRNTAKRVRYIRPGTDLEIIT